MSHIALCAIVTWTFFSVLFYCRLKTEAGKWLMNVRLFHEENVKETGKYNQKENNWSVNLAFDQRYKGEKIKRVPTKTAYLDESTFSPCLCFAFIYFLWQIDLILSRCLWAIDNVSSCWFSPLVLCSEADHDFR